MLFIVFLGIVDSMKSFETVVKILKKIVNVLQANMNAERLTISVTILPFVDCANGVNIGLNDQAFISTPRKSERKQGHALYEGIDSALREAFSDLEAKETAGARELLLEQVMLRMTFQAWMHDADNVRMGLEPVCDFHAATAVLREAHGERAQAAQR